MRRRSEVARADRQQARLFAALGDERRLRVVARLSSEGPLSITRLVEGAGVSRQAVTKHLSVLAGAGLLTVERAGRESVCRLETLRLSHARRLLDAISGEWDETLERLRAFVED